MEEILANITIGVGGGVAILYWTYKQARKVIPQFLMKNLIGPEPLNPLPLRAPVYQQPAASPDNAAADYSGKMS